MRTLAIVTIFFVVLLLQVEAKNAAAAVFYALNQVGKGYSQSQCTGRSGECCRLGPNCFDCSGLVYKAWQAGGVTLPLTTHGYPSSGLRRITTLTTSSLQPGDVLWRSGHVGIYDGRGNVIQATNPRTGVLKTPLSNYLRYYGATCAYRP